MPVLAFPNVVPDAVYRIRSSERSSPELYLEWQSGDNDIKPVELKRDSDAQKWKISAQQDDLYKIENVGSNRYMVAKPFVDDGILRYRLFSESSATYWTLEPRGDDFIIGMPDNAMCAHLEKNNRIIMWERSGLKHQRWILDSVDAINHTGGNQTGGTGQTTNPSTGTGQTTNPSTGTGQTTNPSTGTGQTTNPSTGTGQTTNPSTGTGGSGVPAVNVSPGLYNIKNRATNSEICIWTGYQYENAPVLVWPATGTARTYSARAWQITPASGGGHTITNAYWVAKGPRCLRDGPFVNQAQNVCKLIPVAGTQYYHIATSLASDSRVLMDSQAPRAINLPATMAQFNKDDQRQQWELNPAH